MSNDQHIHGDEVHGDKIDGDKHETHVHNYGISNKPITKDDLSIEEKEILIAGYTYGIMSHYILAMPLHIPEIIAGERTFPREWKYMQALKALRERNLIRRINGTKEPAEYEFTMLGDQIAESLGATGPTSK